MDADHKETKTPSIAVESVFYHVKPISPVTD